MWENNYIQTLVSKGSFKDVLYCLIAENKFNVKELRRNDL